MKSTYTSENELLLEKKYKERKKKKKWKWSDWKVFDISSLIFDVVDRTMYRKRTQNTYEKSLKASSSTSIQFTLQLIEPISVQLLFRFLIFFFCVCVQL